MLSSLFSFESAGKRIKKISKIILFVVAILEVVGSIALAIIGIASESIELIAFGVVLILVGPFLAYFSYLLAYGFAEIVDNVVSINNKSAGTTVRNQFNTELPDL